MNDKDLTRENARRDWLAALLLRQPDRFMPRFAAALARWQTLSRGFRRRITRRMAATAAGAALILAMAGSPLLVPRVHAASIDVDDHMVIEAEDGFCSLREALANAAADSQIFGLAGECEAGSGIDTINLPVDGDFLIEDAIAITPFGDFGLVSGFDEVIIEGNGSTIRRDPADPDEFALLVNIDGDLTLKDVTISGGSGTFGGGLFTYASDLIMIDSTVSDNSAYFTGGGVASYGGDVLIDGSTISGNTSSYFAGGLATIAGTLDIVNSTISGNSAEAIGGVSVGFFLIATYEVTATITNSTITDNTGFSGAGGIFVNEYSDLTISRSIVSGNRAGILDGLEMFTYDGTITAGDHNVFGHAGLTDVEAFYGFAPTGSDVNATSDGADIPLGQILDTTLADNGGPTLTHNLVLGSPALDFAPDADCESPSLTDGVDQRGAARPFDVVGEGNEITDTCDAGSVEAESPIPFTPASVFMSTRTAGTTGDGLDFGSEDIISWDGSAWSMWFDGSDAGLATTGKARHNINALWIPDPNGEDVVMSFAQNRRTVPGVGPKVDGMDLVWWDGASFSFYFDGSDVYLTNKTQEKIDGLHILDGSESPIGGGSCVAYLLISTQGPGKVPNHSGGQLKFQGEDVLGFCATSLGEDTAGLWHMVLDGSDEGMPRNSTDSISVSDDGGTLRLTTQGAFIVDAAAGGHSMVYEFDFGTGDFSGPVFDAAAEGLPVKVDGLQVDGDLP